MCGNNTSIMQHEADDDKKYIQFDTQSKRMYFPIVMVNKDCKKYPKFKIMIDKFS